MAEAAPTIISDGALDFLGGQDASKIPDRIAENAYYAGVNVSAQRGSLRPRWGKEKLSLSFTDERLTLPNYTTRPYRDIFLSGKYQALIPYSVGQEFFFVVVICGIIYLVNQQTYAVSVIPINGGSRINEYAARVYWESAGKYLVIHDYPAYPVIVENFTARRADPTKSEVPISVLGAYNQNRLFIANAGNEFTAGDPAGSLAAPDAPITFLEVETPSSPFYGQVFQLSTNYNNDPITAMTFLSTVDTSTGIGPLLVATQNAIWSFQSQQPRTAWQNGQFGASFVDNVGVAGPRSICNVNSDVFFISGDGQVRSASMSRNEQGRWARIPISREVENWLKYLDSDLVHFASIGYYNNKIFFTANPYRTKAQDTRGVATTDYANGGMVVLSTDNIATLGQGGQPTWDGLWTGVRPMDMITSNHEFFIIAKDQEVQNAIYRVDPDLTYDYINGRKRFIRSTIYTREYDFKDAFQTKELHSIEFNFDNIQGDFMMDVQFKPSHGPYFLDWRTYSFSAPWQSCTATIPDAVANGYAGQVIRDVNLGTPLSNQLCNPATQELYNFFRKVQLKLSIVSKYWEIHEYKINAIARPQYRNITVCDNMQPVAMGEQCDNDWSIIEEDICLTKK